MNIRLAKKSTPYGVRLPENKLTEKSPIEPAPLPETVFLPLQQAMGAPPKALVKRGDKVLTGQKVAEKTESRRISQLANFPPEIQG